MSAVYDEVKREARRLRPEGFSTIGGSQADWSVTDASSGSTQGAGGGTIIVLHPAYPGVIPSKPFTWVVDSQSAATMGVGSEWVATEPINDIGVVDVRWKRRVVATGIVVVKTASLPRRAPRVIFGDYSDQ